VRSRHGRGLSPITANLQVSTNIGRRYWPESASPPVLARIDRPPQAEAHGPWTCATAMASTNLRCSEAGVMPTAASSSCGSVGTSATRCGAAGSEFGQRPIEPFPVHETIAVAKGILVCRVGGGQEVMASSATSRYRCPSWLEPSRGT
jgi:hypothetical protein